jgi:putative flippase GtrA
MEKIRTIASSPVLHQFVRYGLSSIIGIGSLFLFNYLFTGVLGLDESIGYFISITLAYAINYILASSYIFKQGASARNARNFLAYTAVFWAINNIFFNLIGHFFHLHYLIITAINIMLFSPIRFLSQKHLVFGKK